MSKRILAGIAVTVAAASTGGCLLFTSVSDLGGGDSANAAGASSAFTAAEPIAHGPPGHSGIAVDEANVYWTNSSVGTLWRAAKTSTDAPVTMAVDKPKTPGPVVAFNGRVYVGAANMANGDDVGLFSYAPDGSGMKQEFGYCRMSRIATADALYIGIDGSSSDDGTIDRFSADSQRSTVVKLMSDSLPTALAFDGAAVYFYEARSPRTIQRVAPGGTAAVFVQEDEVTDLLADTTNLYALTITGNLVAHPLAGGAPRTIAGGLVGARRLGADAAAFYVSAAGLDPSSGRIVRIQKSDGATSDLATNQAGPSALAVSPSGVYWVNSGDGSVMRAVRR